MIYYSVMKDVAGVATEIWKAPKFLMPGALAPRHISSPRAITLADALQADIANTVTLGFELPEGMLGDIAVPSNATDPLPINTTIEYLFLEGNAARLVPEAGVTILTLIDGPAVMDEPGSITRLRKTGLNSWLMYSVRGNLGVQSASAYSVPFLFSLRPEHLRQERTGASATTPVNVGDPIGSLRNLGTRGGWATTIADNRRPILRQAPTGEYYAEFDASNDFLEYAGAALNMARINFFCGVRQRVPSPASSTGIVTFGTAITGDVNRNDGGYLAANPAEFGMAFFVGNPSGGGRGVCGAPGMFGRNPHVIEVQQLGNGQKPTMWVDDMPVNQDATVPTSLTTMGGKLLFGARQANNAEGVANFGAIDLYEFVATDASVPLTTAQRAAITAYVRGRTPRTGPVYPVMPDLAARDAARAVLKAQVFGGGGIPTDVATLAAEDRFAINYGAVTGIASFEKMTIPGYALRPRLITPASPRNDLTVIVWAGHSTGIWTYSIPAAVVQQLLNLGIRVIVMVLPGGSNDYTSGNLVQHDTAQPSWAEWVGPASIAMNTLRASHPAMKFYMCGISGGGLAATMCAAVDDRIVGSAQFVASFPEFIHQNRDWEQRLENVDAGYLDLYLLAASNGWHNHVLYEYDPIGFNRANFNVRGIDWSPTIAAAAAALGGDYDLSWVNYNQHTFEATSFAAQFIARLPAP